MTLHIIIKDGKTFKGKTLSEFQDNLCSDGYPSEMSHEERDKLRHFEKREGRRARKEELEKIDR